MYFLFASVLKDNVKNCKEKIIKTLAKKFIRCYNDYTRHALESY